LSDVRTPEQRSRPSRHLTVAQAAQELSCSRKFIYEAIWQGTLPHLKVGRAIRISRSDWERFLQSLR